MTDLRRSSSQLAGVAQLAEQPKPAARTLIGAREAARRLGVHENTIRNWADRGWLTAVRLPSGVRRFDPVEIANVLGAPRSDVRGQVVEGDVLP